MVPRRRALAALLLSTSIAVAGCHHSSTGSSSGNNPNNTGGTSPSNAGNTSNSSNGGTEGQRKGEQPQAADAGNRNQTHTAPDSREPVNSVSGKPSVESDDGSPRAVAHRSVAQPGAPEGTLAGQAARQVQQAQPAQPQH